MARPADPFRTLEVSRGATLDEVKASYRRLAKLYHPDSAGEKALPRFLAIQAAYESLTEGPARIRLGTTPRDRGARASSAPGSRSTGAGARAAGTASRSPGSGPRSTTAGGRSSAAGTGRAGQAGRGSTSSANGSGGSSAGSTAGPRPRRDRRKPTSTSYDGADLEPFEPEWEGASWYGGSSGTYWTLNPKEFADPRKHGPEYQARGRREAAKAEQAARAAAAAQPAAAAEPAAAPEHPAAPEHAAAGPAAAAEPAAAEPTATASTAAGPMATEGEADDSHGRAATQPRDSDAPPATRTTASAGDGAGDPVTQRPAAATSSGSAASAAPRAERPTPPIQTTQAEDLPPDGGPVPAAAGFRASAVRFVRGLTGTARRGA